ncbi:hypothetical protein PPERSA_02619 [Pseudocohnilembus persalinus]|uniref:Uncharacterized protein n=1 Tax=Pseudocohnilembus persalinus TaxID=266149 RepID=A0A0V0R5I4_PSEPJ|nr:hypothetical protein PPERSA_02619 [Pseudocohnilembus persalinus]|eukprot:KRX09747.1 hypothetical protein PPERSA_02619 [Pseudocohnilembus persalinus]
MQNTVLDPSLLKTKQQQEREEQEALQMELLRQKFGESKSPNSQAFKETFMQIKQMLVQNEKYQELYERDLDNNQSQSQDLYQSVRRFVLKERIKNHKGSNFKDVIEYTKILQKEKEQKRLKQSEDYNLDQDILIKIQQPYFQSSLNESRGKKKTVIIHPRKQSTQFQQNSNGIQENNQKIEDFGQAKNNINNISFQIVDSLQSPVKSNNGNQSKSLLCNQSDNQLMTNSNSGENKNKNLEHLSFFKRGYVEKQQNQFLINNKNQDLQDPTEKKLKIVNSEKNFNDFSCQNQVQLRKNKSRNTVKFQDSPKISDFHGNFDIIQTLKLGENFNQNPVQINYENQNKFKLRKSQSQHNFISQTLLKKNNTIVMKNGAIINNNCRINSSNNIFKNTEINGKLYEMKQKIIDKQKLKNQKEQTQIGDLKESILFQNNNSIVLHQNSNSEQILNTNHGENKEKEECLKISQFENQSRNNQNLKQSLNQIQDDQIEKKIQKTCDQLEKSKYIEEEQFVQARDYQKKRTFIKNQLSQNYQKQIQNSNNTPKNYAQFVKKQPSSNFKNTYSCNTPKSQELQNKKGQIQVQSQKNLLKIEGLLSEKDKQFQFLTPQKQQEKTRKNSHFFKFCEQKAGQNNQNELLMLRKINTDNSIQSSDLDESSSMK